MLTARLCPVCGAPRRFARELRWLGNGTIVQRKNPHHRLVFIECENVDATYRNIEEIIDLPIEHLLIEAKGRATFDFVDHMLLSGVKSAVRVGGTRFIARHVTVFAGLMGYGRIKLTDLRRIHGRDDYATFRVEEPYSIPLFCGDVAGTLNVVDRREAAVSYERISPDVYEVTGRVSDNSLELQERLEARKYPYKPGDIEIEKCTGCGGPALLSEYRWDLDRGVIVGRTSGHRKAIIGPAALEAIIDKLEKELGDTVTETVIEAQRRFVKTGYYSLEEASSLDGLRIHLAKRGLGNLREMDWKEDRLYLRLENACLHLILVGLAKGLFELAAGVGAEAAWEVASDGDFIIEVAKRT